MLKSFMYVPTESDGGECQNKSTVMTVNKQMGAQTRIYLLMPKHMISCISILGTGEEEEEEERRRERGA